MDRQLKLALKISAEVSAARRSIDELSGRIDKVGASSKRAETDADGLNASLRRVGEAGAAYFTLSALRGLVTELRSAQLEAIKLRNTMSYALGGNAAGLEGLAWAAELARRLGLDLLATQQGFASFSASAATANLSAAQTRDIFEAVSMATAALGLGADDARGIFLALSQMLSKGTVSAEELRGQLGERLPGAFALAAKAMGVNTQALGDMLQKGEIASAVFLPRFARELEAAFGAAAGSAAEGAIGNVNRLNNAITQIKRNLGTASDMAGITAPRWFTAAIDEANAVLETFIQRGEYAKGLWLSVGGLALGAIGQGYVSRANRDKRFLEIASEMSRIESVQARADARDAMVGRSPEDAARNRSAREDSLAMLRKEMAAIVELNNAEASQVSLREQVRRKIQEGLATMRASATAEKEAAAAAKAKKTDDPLAALLRATDTGKLEEYERMLGLLDQRLKAGKILAQQYTEAVAKLVDTTFGDRIRASQHETEANARSVAALQGQAFDAALEAEDARVAAETALRIEQKDFLDGLEQEAFLAGMSNADRETALMLLEAEKLGITDINRLLEARAKIQAANQAQSAMQEAQRQQDDLYRSVQDGVRGAIAQGIIDAWDGGGRSAAEALGKALRNALANALAGSLTDSLLGLLGGKQGVMGIAGAFGFGGKRDGSSPQSAVYTQDVASGGAVTAAVTAGQKGIVDRIKDGLGTIWSGLRSGFSAMLSALGSLLSGVASSLGAGVRGLASLLGFSSGGFSGWGDPTKPAGVVHGREFTFSWPAVQHIGVDVLDGLHRAALGQVIPASVAFATAGLGADMPSGGTAAMARSAGTITLQVHPDALHMTLRDWLEGELARQAATR